MEHGRVEQRRRHRAQLGQDLQRGAERVRAQRHRGVLGLVLPLALDRGAELHRLHVEPVRLVLDEGAIVVGPLDHHRDVLLVNVLELLDAPVEDPLAGVDEPRPAVVGPVGEGARHVDLAHQND